MNSSRDCWSCAKRAAGCVGMTGPRDLEPACWVPEQEMETGQVFTIPMRCSGKTAAMKAALERAEKQVQQIKQHLTETRPEPSTEDLLEGVHLERREPTAAEALERARREFELHEAGRRAYQESLERLAKEIDRQLERLLTERYPGTPIEAFISSFIPGGLRITAPDGVAFDFVYTTHGPNTADGATTMTMELTVTGAKIGGKQECKR